MTANHCRPLTNQQLECFMAKNDLTAARLRDVLNYDPASGVFTRLQCEQRPDVAGRPTSEGRHSNGYQRIAVDGGRYYSHRLAYLYMTGAWPEHEVDHINGIRHDNRWANLRAATPRLNQQNKRRARVDSQSGVLGVSWDAARGWWVARIKVADTYKYLGRFETKTEARAAYLSAKRQHHAGCTI